MLIMHNWRGAWKLPVRELRNIPLGSHCGESMELEGRELTVNTPPHLLLNPNEIHENQQFWLH